MAILPKLTFPFYFFCAYGFSRSYDDPNIFYYFILVGIFRIVLHSLGRFETLAFNFMKSVYIFWFALFPILFIIAILDVSPWGLNAQYLKEVNYSSSKEGLGLHGWMCFGFLFYIAVAVIEIIVNEKIKSRLNIGLLGFGPQEKYLHKRLKKKGWHIITHYSNENYHSQQVIDLWKKDYSKLTSFIKPLEINSIKEDFLIITQNDVLEESHIGEIQGVVQLILTNNLHQKADHDYPYCYTQSDLTYHEFCNPSKTKKQLKIMVSGEVNIKKLKNILFCLGWTESKIIIETILSKQKETNDKPK